MAYDAASTDQWQAAVQNTAATPASWGTHRLQDRSKAGCKSSHSPAEHGDVGDCSRRPTSAKRHTVAQLSPGRARVGTGIIAPAFPCIRQRLMSCDDLAASSRAARREIIYTDGLDRIGDGKRIGDAVRRFVRRRFTNMMMRQRRRTSSDTRASVAYTHGYKK